MEKIRKEMQEVKVVDYYVEVGDVITIPGKRGQFVVEEAKMTGGGMAHNDVYPDAWHVKARLLRKKRVDSKDGSSLQYNPKAQLVKFTQHTKSYNNVIDGVKKVSAMVKIVDFQEI